MTETDKTLIVALQSHKGGVGKTTIGLSIAREWLEEKRSAIILDADLLGTELADLWPASTERWSMGLLAMLTQSTGGNSSFDDWLKTKLGPKPSAGQKIPGLPALPLLKGVWCPVIPTLREAKPGADRDEEVKGLAGRLVTDDFGLAQVRRRMALLLARLVLNWSPELIVIDCSPFHLALGRAIEQVFSEPPKGLLDDHSQALKKCRFALLEVIGQDLSDLVALPHLVKEGIEKSKKQKTVHRGGLDHNLGHPC
jgi:hypothetical protein